MKDKNDKIKIKIVKIGYFPFELNVKKIEKYKSKLFTINGNVEEIKGIERLTSNNSYYDNQYLVDKINSFKFEKQDYDFIFVISNIKFEDDWFSKILDDNKVIMSYYSILERLQNNSIPIENAVLTLLYSYAFLFKKFNKIPSKDEEKNFLHTDTRGCVFDLSSSDDIVYSCITPIICKECLNDLNNISDNLIGSVQKELKKIKKTTDNRMFSIVKKNPIVSSLFAISLPISLSLLTTNYIQNLNIYIQLFFILVPIILLGIIWIKSIKNRK